MVHEMLLKYPLCKPTHPILVCSVLLFSYSILFLHPNFQVTYLSTNAKSIAPVTFEVVRIITLGNLKYQYRELHITSVVDKATGEVLLHPHPL